MPRLEEVSYSEAECVAAVGDYYQFLTKMYLDVSEVIYSPEGGWPSITGADAGVLAKFGKNDTVISLLAHLPYIRTIDGPDEHPHAIAEHVFADWNNAFTRMCMWPDRNVEEWRIATEGYPFYEVAPPHVVGLVAGGNGTPVILVDTELGIIVWDDYPYKHSETHLREPIWDDPYDYAPEDEAEFRGDATAWAITDFFEVLKGLFLELYYIPQNSRTVVLGEETFGHPQGMLAMLRQIYHEHGWPDLSAYRKKDCLKAVKAAMEANYPSEC